MATLTAPRLQHVRPVDDELLIGDLVQPGHPLFGLIWINGNRVSGTPCFYATRVPIATLFNCIAEGLTLEQFLDDFEGVTREQALAVLQLAQSRLLDELPRP